MKYLPFMALLSPRIKIAQGLYFSFLIFILLNSCGRGKEPSIIIEMFYASQTTHNAPLQDALFINEDIARKCNIMISDRINAYGFYLSHKRIGSHRQISFSGGRRTETITYIFEVLSEKARTRERLTIMKPIMSKSFLIVDYEIREETPEEDSFTSPNVI